MFPRCRYDVPVLFPFTGVVFVRSVTEIGGLSRVYEDLESGRFSGGDGVMKNGAKAIGELTSSPSPRLITARIRADKDTVSIQKLFIFFGRTISGNLSRVWITETNFQYDCVYPKEQDRELVLQTCLM